MSSIKKLATFLAPKFRVLMNFMLAQGITLIGNLLYGLLCVRLLPQADYAMFVVLFGVQGTVVVLMDINFSGSLVPLVGERVDDRQLIADYVASLRRIALWVYVAVGGGLVVVYPYLVKNRHWSWQIIASMVVTLLVSTWFSRVSATYAAVLIMMRDRAKWYQGQMISSLGTLVLLGVFWAVHALYGFTAILLNVVGIVFTATFYYLRSRRLLGVVGVPTAQKRKAIVRLAMPNIPQSIFYALQGQVALMLITFFGHTNGVASVGALARLGQIFSLFGYMNPMLVEPYFAKLPKEKLKYSYITALGIAGLVCGVMTVVASFFPNVFLWLLGSQYANLQFEVVLVIAAGAISTFSNVLWFIHSARRFIYWWSNILNIILIFLAQLLFVLKADMGTVRAVLWLNLATNAVSLFINVLSGFYGFVKGPREAETGPVVPGPTLESTEMEELEAGRP